jgi:diguanylate cyclase (GGDEF)-like protein
VLPIGIAIARDRDCRFVQPNRALARMFGVASNQNTSMTPAEGEPLPAARFLGGGRVLPATELPMQVAARDNLEVVDMEMELVREGAPAITILGYAAPLLDEKGAPYGAIGACLDITERKRAEETARSLAYHDVLTGLPNRLLMRDRLVQGLALCRRDRRPLGLLFMDLDRFKLVNDSLGHGTGDRLLQMVAERLRGCVREGDTVARLGGDEFTILLPGLAQGTDAAAVATKVLESLRRRPYSVDGHDLYVTSSVGISVFPDDGDDPETLLKNADAAMYRAKDQGRDQYQLYAPAMNAAAMVRLSLESGLRRALANGELVLHYQPLVHLGDRRVYGVEALLRWQHPELGLLPPGEFIPVAEVTGLALEFGPWVLRTACAQVKRWQASGFPELSLAVNLTAREFDQSDLVEKVAAALAETGLEARFLDLEITESRAMQNAEATVRTLRGLKSLGVRISIDDFGTGYSSLAYLTRFPIDTLKIDQSFIRDITRDADDAALTAAMIAMAHNLNLQVVAEGVETEQQLAFLMAGHCDRMQGFLFSRPLPPDAVERALSLTLPA